MMAVILVLCLSVFAAAGQTVTASYSKEKCMPVKNGKCVSRLVKAMYNWKTGRGKITIEPSVLLSPTSGWISIVGYDSDGIRLGNIRTFYAEINNDKCHECEDGGVFSSEDFTEQENELPTSMRHDVRKIKIEGNVETIKIFCNSGYRYEEKSKNCVTE